MKIRDYFDINPKNNTNKFSDFIWYFDTSSVSNGHIVSLDLLEGNFPSRAQRLIQKNDILYSSVRPNLRHYYFYNDDYEHAVASTGFLLLRKKPESEVCSKFAYHYLTLNTVVKHLHNIAELSQATFPTCSYKDVGNIDLPDFDYKSQIIITSVLSNYDQLIDTNNKRIKLLEQIVQEIYKEWFVRFRFPNYQNTKFENGIPSGWKIDKIKNIVVRRPYGKTYKKNELLSDGEVIVIDQSADDKMGYHNSQPDHLACLDNPILLFGDHSCKYVLMTCNFSLGENVIPYKSNISSNFDYYLYYATKDIIKTEEYKRHWNRYVNFGIYIPTNDLIDKFCNIIKKNVILINNLKKQNDNLIKQRDLLLPRLMSGKLEVK